MKIFSHCITGLLIGIGVFMIAVEKGLWSHIGILVLSIGCFYAGICDSDLYKNSKVEDENSDS